MKNPNLYEEFHSNASIQKRIIGDSDFTYFNTIRFLKRIIGNKDNLKVLDFGCGVGTLSLYLASRGHTVTGVDVSKKAIETSKKNAEYLGFESSIRFYNISDWVKKKNSQKFDLIVCSEVIEHVPNDKSTIEKLSQTLKKGGLFFISTPSLDAPLYKLGLLNNFDLRVGHLRRYTQSSLRHILTTNGLQIVSCEIKEGILRNLLYTNESLGIIIKFLKKPLSNIIMIIDSLLVNITGGSNIYIAGEKI